MYTSLKEVFDRHFMHVKFNDNLTREIQRYQIWMGTRSADHIQFLGSNLLGVHVLRFGAREISKFFATVANVDQDALTRDIRSLNTIYHENSITGDIFNLTLFYIMHRYYNAANLTRPKREKGLFDVGMIFGYRCLFALTNNYFQYPADIKVAQAAYANLSKKNLIKQLGTWKKVCEYRTKNMVMYGGLNSERLTLFNDDLEITKIIGDSQNRYKAMVHGYYGEFDKVHKDGESIATTSSTIVDVDGDAVLREKTTGGDTLTTYMRNLMNDPNGFIQGNLVTVVADQNSNTSYKTIMHTLQWLTKAYTSPKYNARIDRWIEQIIAQSLYYIEYNVPLIHRRDTAYILKVLKDMYLATRSTDPTLLSIREEGEKFVRDCNRNVSDSLLSATRTALILYITLRAMVGTRG